MKYELAKKLKEAGFPQDNNGFVYEKGLNFVIHKSNDRLDWQNIECNAPTLSELIEACGEEFEYLIHLVLEKEWVAHAFGELQGRSTTPEEAVANLWLELNKK